MLRLIPFLMLIASAACSPQKAVVAAPPETRAERLAVLDRIATECRVPRAMLELVGEDRLRLRPSANEPYERVECVLLRTDRLNLPVGNVDLVGNAAAAATNEAAPAVENTAATEANDAAPN